VPATIVTLTALSFAKVQSETARALFTLVLCGALSMTACALIFRNRIVRLCRDRFPALDDRSTARATVVVGAILGVVVSVSSVGAGAVGVIVLIILYPQLPMARIVGSDIAHAVPLTLVAGAGHWIIGSVDWHIMSSLLSGSVPGIIIGSYVAVRVPERALQIALAVTLMIVAGKLAHDEFLAHSMLVTAFTHRSPN